MGLISRLVDHKGIDLVSSSIEELLSESLQFVVLGTGDWKYEQMLCDSQHKYPGKVQQRRSRSTTTLSRKIYSAADLFLDAVQRRALRPCADLSRYAYGVIPRRARDGRPGRTRSATSRRRLGRQRLVFKPFSGKDMMCASARARSVSTKTGHSGRSSLRRVMECDFSWEKPARRTWIFFEALASR